MEKYKGITLPEVERRNNHFDDNKVLIHRIYTLKQHAQETLLKLCEHYQNLLPIESPLNQIVQKLPKAYQHLKGRQSAIAHVRTLPLINNDPCIQELRDQILQDDITLQNIQKELVQKNQGLVNLIIQSFINNNLLRDGFEVFEDLKQAGSIGLMIAIDKFDPKKKCEFSTYAVWWIRQKIQETFRTHCRNIQIPAGQEEYLSLICKAQKTIPEENQNNPDMIEKVIQQMPVSGKLKKSIKTATIAYILRIQQAVFESLDAPVGNEVKNTLLERVESNMVLSRKEFRREELIEVLKSISELSQIELGVIIAHYGLIDEQSNSYASLATTYGWSHEKMRKIHEVALRKIKHAIACNPSLDCDLRSFL